jgi:hypothetical protein
VKLDGPHPRTEHLKYANVCSQYCPLCSLNGALLSCATLAHNLAIAGALCAAFSQGAVYMVRSVLRPNEPEAFTPGCGRSAP